MTAQIRKSQIHPLGGEDKFAELVDQHIANMNEWRQHMANVGREPTKYTGYPPPQASPLVNASVKEVDDGHGMQHWERDYEVVNDDPPPELLLQHKKNSLFNHISQMETVASAGVLPAGKRRHLNIRQSDIVAADAKRAQYVVQDSERLKLEALNDMPEDDRRDAAKVMSLLARLNLDQETIDNRVRDMRPPEDTKFLAEHADRVARYDAIYRHAAALHAEIEDLSVENIDTWKPRDFPT